MQPVSYSAAVINYVKELTADKYKNYPSEVEDCVVKNINALALRVIDNIKTHPNLRFLYLQLSKPEAHCDKKGLSLITQAFQEKYDINIAFDELSSYKEDNTHVLLRGISVNLTQCKGYRINVSFKADNPLIFPRANVQMIIAPYTLADHFKVEWEKAKAGIGTTVTFSVGDKTFHAHKSKLVMHSSYFEGLYRSSMVETRDDAVAKMDDISTEYFEVVLRFIYMGCLDDSYKELVKLFELILIADRFGVVKLGDLCVERIQRHLQQNSVDAAGMMSIFSVVEQIDPKSLLLDTCLMQIESARELKNCLIGALSKKNIARFTEVAKKRDLKFVLEQIELCKTYNPSLN